MILASSRRVMLRKVANPTSNVAGDDEILKPSIHW